MASKKLLATLGIAFILFLGLGLVSAKPVLYPQTGTSATAIPNSEVELQFRIFNDHTSDLTAITYEVEDLISVFESIDSTNIQLIGLPLEIQNNTNSSLVKLKIKIPEYQKQGIYLGNLKISGKYTANTISDNWPIRITVNQTHSIAITQTKQLSLNQNGTISVKNTGNTELTDIQLSSTGDFNVNFSKSIISSILPGEVVSVNIFSDNLENQNLKTNYATIKATTSEGVNTSMQVSFAGFFCRNGNVGNSGLQILRIRDRSGLKDYWEWEPLDDIEVDVKIENNVGNDLDLMVELILADSNGNKISDFVEDEDDLEKDISLDDDNSETVTFKFHLSLDADEGDYYLHAKVYEEGKEDKLCTSLIAEEGGNQKIININKEKNKITVKGKDVPSTISCDSSAEAILKVYNIGDNDEERVAIKLFSPELGITTEKEITNLDEGDNQEVPFIIKMPNNAKSGDYRFRVLTRYDYDEDDETYNEVSLTEDFYKFDVKVIGDCVVRPAPSVNANLASSAKVGEELSIDITLKNNGNESMTFVIAPLDYNGWSDFVETTPSVLTIGAGETGKANIKLKPIKSGEQTFNIKTVYNGQTKLQPVKVTIEQLKSGVITGFVSGMGTTSLILVSGIALLALLIIILLVVKLVTRNPKKTSEF